MGNRLSNPSPQFFTNSGQVNTGGNLAFYTTGTTTLATVYTNRSLGIAAQNPLPLDSAGRMQTDCFLDPAVTYKVILNDINGVPIWTKDPVVDFVASINASLQVTAGNPNTQIAGTAGTVGGASASMAYDITNNILYVCTTTGTATTAVWTAVTNTFTGNEDVRTANYTIVLADAGRIQTANSATAITFTLTAASTIGASKLYGIKNIGAGVLTISPSGSDKIDTLSNWTLVQPEGIILYSTGSAWRILAAIPVGSFPNEVTVASATTTNILGAASEAIAISGTTTITSFGTGPNRKRFCRATGIFTITQNATSLILPGAANITTAVGDTFTVVSDSSSNARVVSYQGTAAVPAVGKVAGRLVLQTFTASGTYTPTAGMLSVLLGAVGGGAGGGGCAQSSAGQQGSGGGGGGGSTSLALKTAAQIGASQTVTVGASTAGGGLGNDGGAGNDTSIGALCIGKGGSGGKGAAANSSGNGGSGGIAGTGDITVLGQAGTAGGSGSIITVILLSGAGGGSGLGFGAGGTAVASTATGTAGSNYGGGGAGGESYNNGAGASGGSGAQGLAFALELVQA